MSIQLYEHRMMPGPEGPQTDFTLFVGPVVCCYHNGGGGMGSGRMAAFCPSDVQHALGTVEDETVQAVGEILKMADFPIGSLTIRTACQSAFAGIDFDSVEARVRDEYGILCLHEEHNRILLRRPRKPGLGDAPSGMSDKKRGFEYVLSMAPDQRIAPGSGLMVMAGATEFDARNDLCAAARDWGFDWVMGLGDLRSFEALERARSTDFIIVMQETYVPLARDLSRKWGIDYVVMPQSYMIEEIDAYYADLQNLLGPFDELHRYRNAVRAFMQRAAELCDGMEIELDEDIALVDALRGYGIDAYQNPDFGMPPMRRRPPAPGGSGGPGPQAPRSGDMHFPTSGPRMRAGAPAGMPRRDLPGKNRAWGYFAVYDAANRLIEEVSQL